MKFKTNTHPLSDLRFLLGFVASCLVIHSASATLLFQEGFNYTSGGPIAGNVNPGSGYAWGVGNANLTVGSVNLTYPNLLDLGGNSLSDVWGSAGTATNGYAAVTSGTIFYSFLLDVTAAPAANNYLTAMNPGTSGPNGSTDASTMYLGSLTGGTTFRFGIRTSGSSQVFTPTGTPFAMNTVYFLVMGYDFSTGIASLYVNPTPGGAQPAATISATSVTAVTQIANVGFKSQSAGPGSFLVDNLLVGTTWGDVTPAVPEPTSMTLLGLGALSLALVRRWARR